MVGAASALLVSSAARGDASAGAPLEAIAQSLFEDARSDLRHGDYAAAYPKLLESERLDPSNGTLLNLVLCEDRLGKLASAWLHARELVPRLPDEDERKPIAARELADLDARVARLTVRLRGAPPESASVQVDGAHRK